jgi:arginine utilization protein RocB
MKFITHEEGYEVTTKNHGKITVPPKTLEFPQVENAQEAIQFAGGEEKLTELFNDLLYSRSKNGALALVRNVASDGKIEDAITRAAKYSKAYDPSQERTSKAELLEGVDKIRELGKDKLKEMSQEELLALLESTLKV